MKQVFYNYFIFSLSFLRYIHLLSPAVPLQLLHVGAVLWQNPDPPAVCCPSMQVKSQVIHLH